MVTPRVSKALNPHKRKLSIAQIRAGFGGKRRRAGLKASKRHKHKARASNPKPKKHRKRAAAKRNPRTKTRVVTKYKYKTRKVYVKAAPRKRRRKATSNPKRRRRSSNPPWLVTMSPVGNPHKRRKSVAAHKRRKKASAHRSSGKRRNPTRRRGARRGRGPARHRNPMVSGHTVKQVVGAAVGFSIAKKVPPMFGPQMNSSPLMSLLSTGITAAVVAWAARKFAPGYADGALIGGGMAVLNVAWNAWAPPSIAGYSALGDFVPGGFPLPQGPVRYALAAAPMEAPNGSAVNVGAFGRAW
jgi:hypothetical protein